jgi:gluconolactonase
MAWEFERVAGPYEGPANGVVWDGSAVLFSLMEAQFVMSFDPATRETKQMRKYANRVNGLGLGPNGELYGCQEGGRRLVQFMPDGRMTAVDALLDGRHHNHPSDLAVDKAGNIWFADPHSRTLAFGPQIFPALDHASVLRLEKNERRAWALTRITYDTVAPRAVALSADEKTLYVAEGEPGRNGPRELRAYPIGSEGVGPYRLMHTFGSDHRGPHRGLEGLALDRDGNIVGCGGWRKSGPGPLIYVFAPSGAVIETHPFPADLPNRCCFGGKDRDRLYVTTAGGELYEAKIGPRGG